MTQDIGRAPEIPAAALEDREGADSGFWLSITELAARKGVTKQTISERVAALEAKGLLHPRPGPGKAKEINVAEYDLAVGEDGDAAKEAGAETKADDGPPRFRDAQAREKEYAADLLYLKLERERGNLLPLTEVQFAADDAASRIVEIVESLPSYAEELAGIATRDGDHAVRVRLKRIAEDMRTQIADAMSALADKAAALSAPQATDTFVQADLPIPPASE